MQQYHYTLYEETLDDERFDENFEQLWGMLKRLWVTIRRQESEREAQVQKFSKFDAPERSRLGAGEHAAIKHEKGFLSGRIKDLEKAWMC